MDLFKVCEEFFSQINPQHYENEEFSPSVIQTMDRNLDPEQVNKLDELPDTLFVFKYILEKLLGLEEYFKKEN